MTKSVTGSVCDFASRMRHKHRDNASLPALYEVAPFPFHCGSRFQRGWHRARGSGVARRSDVVQGGGAVSEWRRSKVVPSQDGAIPGSGTARRRGGVRSRGRRRSRLGAVVEMAAAKFGVFCLVGSKSKAESYKTRMRYGNTIQLKVMIKTQ